MKSKDVDSDADEIIKKYLKKKGKFTIVIMIIQ
jgi:hypothetical protein